MTQREAVWLADGGTCVACGKRWRKAAGSWEWQAHHCIPAQRLRREHVPSRYIRTEALCVVLCASPCHERQTTAFRRVPYEFLPLRIRRAASELGPWAEDALRRQHPSA